MNKLVRALAALMLMTTVLFLGCKKEVKPLVDTSNVTNVTSSTVTAGGIVTSDGGSNVIERGVCWSKNSNPTVSDSHLASGTGVGSFTCPIEGLEAATTYHVRAYAINSVGLSYGNDVTFTTLTDSGGGGDPNPNPNPGPNPEGAPEVTTGDVTNITATSAKVNGNVISNGTSSVTDRGICWGTNHNPTLNEGLVSCGTGTGSFTAELTNLVLGTTYYARAYATNASGTAYGDEVSFVTVAPGGVPVGAISGVFNAGQRFVYFSKGNLQYQPSSNTWRFAEHQYDIIGDMNQYASSYYNGWLDLFGWATSGYNHGAVAYQPWSTSTQYLDYYAYGNADYSLYDQTGQADWGYNAISNGGNATNLWNTLTKDEWVYIINARYTESQMRYVRARVNNVNGLILLPDDWNPSTYALSGANSITYYYYLNSISAADWPTLEAAGAVFLPAAGFRSGTTYTNYAAYGGGGLGNYWSSYCGEGSPYCLYFSEYTENSSYNVVNPQYHYNQFYGCSVRLVQTVNR